MHVFLIHADDGHQRNALGGHGNKVFGPSIPARADAIGVADDEAIAVADEASDGVTAVPILGGFAQDVADVHMLGDLGLNCGALEPLVLEGLEEAIVFFV